MSAKSSKGGSGLSFSVTGGKRRETAMLCKIPHATIILQHFSGEYRKRERRQKKRRFQHPKACSIIHLVLHNEWLKRHYAGVVGEANGVTSQDLLG